MDSSSLNESQWLAESNVIFFFDYFLTVFLTVPSIFQSFGF